MRLNYATHFGKNLPYSLCSQETRVLCCLAIQGQVLVATTDTSEGLELHVFHFSEHLKLKLAGNELSQLGNLYSIEYFPLICCFSGFLGRGLGMILDGTLVLIDGKSLNLDI